MRRCFQGFHQPKQFAGYDKQAQVTEYAGVMFRSRLEATWASFFDLAGMTWEYEPIRLEGWIPDFRLFGHFLCEVKPIQMTGFAVASTEYQWIRKALVRGTALIFGEAPSDCLACMVHGDDLGVSGRTVFFDPDAPFKMMSVDGDGGSHPLRGNAKWLWREAGQNLIRATIQPGLFRKTEARA